MISISIHALREEGDVFLAVVVVVGTVFLSTPSARRATIQTKKAKKSKKISIHALREEGDNGFADSVNHFFISIHALREEGD